MSRGKGEDGKAPIAALTEAVVSGAGLPGLVRAASEALGMPVAFLDRSGIVLATAGATRDQEEKLSGGGKGIETVPLAIGETSVGDLRYVGKAPDEGLVGLVSALAALEVERVRTAEWGSEEEATELIQEVIAGPLGDPGEFGSRARSIGCDPSRGAGVLMVRAHSGSAQEGDWRSRVLELVLRTVRSAARGSIAAPVEGQRGSVVAILVPSADEERLVKVQEALDLELPRALKGLVVTISRSRPAGGVEGLPQAADEALLALNVGEAEGRSPIAFEETGAYRLLLGTSEEELTRFYSETVEPLVLYDEQYETDLVATVEAYLDSDANVPATAKKMFTHRHTIRYRLERVRDLSGHDATATEGRERLGLGIKAMRVLGIAPPRGRTHERAQG